MVFLGVCVCECIGVRMVFWTCELMRTVDVAEGRNFVTVGIAKFLPTALTYRR